MEGFINTVDTYEENGEEIVAADIINRTITDFVDDRIKVVSRFVFYGCINLKRVALPKVTEIYFDAFKGCYNLQTLIVGTEINEVCKFKYTSQPINNSQLSIYVPDNLVEDYKNASGWSSYYADKIKPIPELPQ